MILSRWWLCLLGLFVVQVGICTGCSGREGARPVSRFVPDSIEIRTGDVIARMGTAWYSELIGSRVSRDTSYSHIGLLERSSSSDSLWVWHMEIDHERGHGGLVREYLGDFVHHAIRYGIYRYEDIDTLAVKAVIADLEGVAPEFDFQFGDNDPQTYYCTELVALILSRSGINGLRATYSIGQRRSYNIDDLLDRGAAVYISQ